MRPLLHPFFRIRLIAAVLAIALSTPGGALQLSAQDAPAVAKPATGRPATVDAPATARPGSSTAPATLASELRKALGDRAGSISTWYAKRGHVPAWQPAMARSVIEYTRQLPRHGLDAFLFDMASVEAAWTRSPGSDAEVARRDLLTTQLAYRVIDTLARGYVDPSKLHPKWKNLPPRVADPFELIDRALVLTPEELPAMFDRAAPQDHRYGKLITTLARYREISDLGGWRKLPDPGRILKKGDRYAGIGLLRARLRAEGDLPEDASRIVPATIDDETDRAVKAFQFRHGIDPDGVIGPATLSELTSPVTHRINALIVNLERLRWMQAGAETSERVEVNIAESVLRMFRGPTHVGTMKVIVGKKGETQTPLFHGDIKYLIFRPYWNIPIGIAHDEIGPHAEKDPDYLVRNNYEIVPRFGVSASEALAITPGNIAAMRAGKLSLRQGTGPENALGLVKFIFPNDSAVYLHDTPNHNLFQRTDRDFSHGCVRVSDPPRLAEFALAANGNWDPVSINAALNDESRPNRRVNLERSIPVYLTYWTATILDDGRVRFDQDIYEHDRALRAELGLGAKARPVAEPVAIPVAEPVAIPVAEPVAR